MRKSGPLTDGIDVHVPVGAVALRGLSALMLLADAANG